MKNGTETAGKATEILEQQFEPLRKWQGQDTARHGKGKASNKEKR